MTLVRLKVDALIGDSIATCLIKAPHVGSHLLVIRVVARAMSGAILT